MRDINLRQLWPSITVTVMALATLTVGARGFGDSLFPECLYYHFFHANIWHLLCNLIALFSFRPRWKTLAVGYVCASVGALVPFVSLAQPTCGMSALIYACIARRYVSYRINPWKLLLLNFIFIIIPNVNWKIHLVSFLLSYAAWTLLRRRKG